VEDPEEDGKVMLEYSGNDWYSGLTEVDVSRYAVLELSDTGVEIQDVAPDKEMFEQRM
jgi:hypothetical protein